MNIMGRKNKSVSQARENIRQANFLKNASYMRMQAAHATAISASKTFNSQRQSKTNMTVSNADNKLTQEMGIQHAILEVESIADGTSEEKANLAVTSRMNESADITADPYGQKNYKTDNGNLSMRESKMQMSMNSQMMQFNPSVMRGSLNSVFRRNELKRIENGNKVSQRQHFLISFIENTSSIELS